MTFDDDMSHQDVDGNVEPPLPPPSPPLESTKSPFVSNLRKRLSCEKRLDHQNGQEVVVRLKNGRRKSLSAADSASMRLALSQTQDKPSQEQEQASLQQEQVQLRRGVPDELTPLRDTYRDQLLGAFTALLAESEAAMQANPEAPSGPAGNSKQQDVAGTSFMQTLSREAALQLVPLEVFVSWVEIEDVVAEGTLSLDIIQQHFEALAVMDARGRSGVDFESFCMLMEQLEAAWQALAGSSVARPEPPVPQEESGQGGSKSEGEDNTTSAPREHCSSPPVGGAGSLADEASRLQQLQPQDLPPSESAPPLPLPKPRSRLAASDVADFISSDILSQGDAASGSGLLARQEQVQEKGTDSGSAPFASRLSRPSPPSPSTTTSDFISTATATYTGSQQEQLQQLASNRQVFVCEATRLNVAQSAARAGQERQLRQRRIAVRQREQAALERRVEAARVGAEQAAVREKQLARDSLELFAHLRVMRCQAEEQRSHEKQVLSHQKMVELEDRRVKVLWKVLAGCPKHFFSPQECRELSRLYLHLRRVTSADASKVTEHVHRRAIERQAQLVSSVRDMRCVVVEEAVAANPLHGFLVQPFPCLQWLQLLSVPPSTIEDFVTLRGHLIRLEVQDAGLDDLAGLFGSPTRDTVRRLRVFRDSYVLGTAARAKGREGTLASDGVGAGEATGPVTFVLPLDDFTETKGTKHINLLWSNLLFLRIHNCGLTRFDRSLSLLPFLSHLDVSGNSISRLKHLGGCLNLRVANLASNRFSSLTGIRGALANVQSLNLSRNSITSLRGLDQLQFLEELDLSFNHVSHVDEVQHLVRLRFLQDLTLEGNPVATLFANTAANGALEHRHPMWETFVKQQQCVWQAVSQSQNQRAVSVRRQEDARLQWAGRELYRVMVFAYFYPEVSPNGYFRTREMVTLDGEDISEIESSIIKRSIFLPPEVAMLPPPESSGGAGPQDRVRSMSSLSLPTGPRSRRQSSCVSEWSVSMLEFEEQGDDQREDRLLSRTESCASEGLGDRDRRSSMGTCSRAFVFACVRRRRSFNKKALASCPSSGPAGDGGKCSGSGSGKSGAEGAGVVRRREVAIVDDKVADHAAVLKYILLH